MTEPVKVCSQAKDEGLCDKKLERYYFNPDINQCQEFDYTGCAGNANNFPTLGECERLCGEVTVPTRTPPVDTASGPCNYVFELLVVFFLCQRYLWLTKKFLRSPLVKVKQVTEMSLLCCTYFIALKNL